MTQDIQPVNQNLISSQLRKFHENV